MEFKHSRFFLLGILFFMACIQADEADLPDVIDFNFHVKPILSDRCFPCHGPDEKTRESELALQLKEHLFRSLDSSNTRFIVDPGNINRSELYSRIQSQDTSYVMPPPESNASLTSVEIATIKKWIKQGAVWKPHWAFISPEKTDFVPKAASVRDGIDILIRRNLKGLGLKPNEAEAKEKWIRRVSFDLTGLPPSAGQISSFLKDERPRAYEDVVERLLASAAYGERMTSTWLDLARYADSHGYQDDRPRTMWPWRDWVISAFNNNLPYDQFATWQIAGDLLPQASFEQKLATGFNRNHAITQEGGVINEEYLTEYAADRTNTFATTFLGLTMECARCHDHKFDPISQEEYYQLFGFFNNVDGERGQVSYFDLAPEPSIPWENENHQKYIDSVTTWITYLEIQKDSLLRNSARSEYVQWKGTIKDQQPWFQSINTDMLAYFPLDNTESNHFENLVPDGPQGHVNVNLPPEILKPERIPGYSGSALKFDGNNFLTMGDLGDFDHFHRFALSCWIKHTRKHDRTAGILSRRNGEQKRQGYDMTLEKNGQVNVRLIHQAGQHQIHVRTKRKLQPQSWHHIAFTYDGSGLAEGVTIYINGKKAPSVIIDNTLNGKSILNGNDLLAGHWNHRARKLRDLYGFEGGAIDEIRVYDKTLSPLEVKALNKPKMASNEVNETALQAFYQHYFDSSLINLEQSLHQYRSLEVSQPKVMIMEERDSINPAYLLDRGAYDAPVKQVSRGTPSQVLPFDSGFAQNRLGLAQWLFDKRHPLTARVLVNRLWQMCFGQGLVKTPEDFGYQGALPSHPVLLDYLAVEMMNSGWDIKAMLKEIVLSKTYRQSNKVDERSLRIDPDNRYLSRGPNKRLSAEMLRDQVLFSSGLLVSQVGGRWVKPYQPGGIWKEMANQIGENKYRIDRGKALYRRSIYTYWKRTIPPPTLITLDAPERAVCTPRRQTTNTPLQALILMNDPQYVEAARVLANQLLLNTEDESWLDHAFLQITSRKISGKEREILLQYYYDQHDHFQMYPEDSDALLQVGEHKVEGQIFAAKLAAATMVVSTIYNLDETKYY
jgi:hypothetical protein